MPHPRHLEKDSLPTKEDEIPQNKDARPRTPYKPAAKASERSPDQIEPDWLISGLAKPCILIKQNRHGSILNISIRRRRKEAS